ncbi:MAG TPA: hypothetical protein VHD83_15775 [Puia sp.]|nr:hypothetical protein [Puia sp.]
MKHLLIYLQLLFAVTSVAQKPVIQYELSGGAGHYDYAPSAIEDEYGIRYMFLCQNKNPFEIVDHVYLFKGIPTAKGYVWQPGTEIIAPSATGWDKIHICDPDVRQLNFAYKGQQYHYIMTYLGVDQWFNHNQIGLAFSKAIEGPYTKYDGNPLVPYTDTTKWGVGQSTSIVLDSNTIQLFYSKSDTPRGRMYARNIKFVNGTIDIGQERVVPHLYPNTYFAYSEKYKFAVSEVRINQDKQIPTWVGNHVRLTRQVRDADMFDEKNDWTEMGLIGASQTRFPRNHNPGLLTDTKGYLIPGRDLIVYFTVAVTGDDWLWSYNLYSATYDHKKLGLP